MRPKPIRPAAGQESVWDYPRPPRLEAASQHIRVVAGDVTIADTHSALRVLETSHPPTYYLPPEDARLDLLLRSSGTSFCEWKGRALYYDALIDGRRIERIAWSYPEPTQRFLELRDYLAFYLPAVDAAYVDGERARPQPGAFYGGWITSDVVGPFKGEPGTSGW